MIYQDPLAYLLGLEGTALLDAWARDHDRKFVDTRLAEIRRLLDDENLRDRGVRAKRVGTVLGYEQASSGPLPACDGDRRLVGLAVVADGVPAGSGALRRRPAVAGHLALPAAGRLTSLPSV